MVLGADLRVEESDEEMPPVHPYAQGKQQHHILTDESPQPQPYSVKSRLSKEEMGAPRVNDFKEESRFEPQQRVEPKPKPTPKPKPPPPPEEYEIRIQHAVESGEVWLKIWSNWTFGAVREALSKKLQRDLKKARFVFKAGTGTAPWIAFKDHEVVGWTPDGSRRNELMLLGVELEPEKEGPLSGAKGGRR